MPDTPEQRARDRFIEVLRSRHMLRPGEEWVIDVNLSAYAHELVAATLRAVAEQVDSNEERANLLGIADEVARGQGQSCCPMCQEVTCDSGCPLSEARTSWARRV